MLERVKKPIIRNEKIGVKKRSWEERGKGKERSNATTCLGVS